MRKKFLIFSLALTLSVGFGGCEFLPIFEETRGPGMSSSSSSSFQEVVSTEEVGVHFLELGNKYTGDCTLIKVGDTEVLIDAGSQKGSAATIVPYIEEYCTDGVLDYVIATHAHQDHIAGFVGTVRAEGVFESFECKRLSIILERNPLRRFGRITRRSATKK